MPPKRAYSGKSDPFRSKRKVHLGRNLPRDSLTTSIDQVQSAFSKPQTLSSQTVTAAIGRPLSSSPKSSQQNPSSPLAAGTGLATQEDIHTARIASNGQYHRSSDDNIFWAVTPSVQRVQAQPQPPPPPADSSLADISLDSNFPSSPLKDAVGRNETNDSIEQILDPDLKRLIEKYNKPTTVSRESPILLSRTPDFARSNSDTNALGKRDRRPGEMTPIIARKKTLSESMVLNLQKLRSHRYTPTTSSIFTSSRPSPPALCGDKDVSQLLVEIGSNLSKQRERSEKIEMVDTEDIEPAQDDSGSPQSDDFSDDDIDMMEIDRLAEVARREAENKEDKAGTLSDSFSFSDDGDEILELRQKYHKITSQLSQAGASEEDGEDEDEDPFNDAVEEEEKVATSAFKDIRMEPENLYVADDDSNKAKACILKEGCYRFQITTIIKNHYKGSGGNKQQIVLRCLAGDDSIQNVLVRDQWTELDFHEGDIIHIVTDSSTDNHHVVDKDHNLLIWHPDTLLSATMTSESIDCRRKAVISHKFQGPGEFALPMIIGNIVHSLFQACLTERDVSDKFMNSVVDQQLEENIIPIMSTQSDKQTIRQMLTEHMVHIREWVGEYLPGKKLQSTATGSGSHYSSLTSHPSFSSSSPPSFQVTNVLDVEENIMSPMFGLRGLIDVVLEARLASGSKYVVPMEIKTGREYITNRAQVSLYTLLVRERYGVHTDLLSLVYTKAQSSYFEALKKNDLRMLVNIRNQLSQYLAYGVTALPPIKGQASCERCFALTECMTLNKVAENGTAEESGIDESLYNSLTEHLDSQAYRDFYSQWNDAITREESLMNSCRRDLWCMSSKEREENGGKSVGGLHLVSAMETGNSPRSFLYTFARDAANYPSIMFSQLSKHDKIILSDEEGKYGLAYGFIEGIRQDFIIINTTRKWINSSVQLAEFDSEKNQVFETVLETSQVSDGLGSLAIDPAVQKKTYRIDKDEMFHGLAMARFNILNLFLPSGDEKRRRLVADLMAPRFSKKPLVHSKIDLSSFNVDQKHAFDTVCRTQDYCLILGMPGTGKTTVIARLIEALVADGKSVLIASYTHSAVDNIVEKLLDLMGNPSLLRVGSPKSISERVRKYSMYSQDTIYPVENQEDFDKAINDTQIVATTCLGIGDAAFVHRKDFDYCIVDEASQVSMPVCLGPLAFADKFVLVGDHYQLPPLILSPEARAKGLDKSLFRILSDAHPESVVELSHQYRMCSEIMTVSNTLIYDGRLKCGNSEVANQSLHIPYPERMKEKSVAVAPENRWLDAVLDSNRRVLFLDHDKVPAKEISHGDKIENPVEAKLIEQIVKALVLCGVSQSSIGLMSFYKAQLRYFYRSLGLFSDIDIMTADRFQGRDKDCIIISLVRSNDKNNAGDLLREWRRVNVAMTRAKSKLIILGSRKLMNTPQFDGFVKLFESKNWFVGLPPKADTFYNNFLEFESSQESEHRSPKRSPKRCKIGSQSKVVQRAHVLRNVLQELGAGGKNMNLKRV
ncbi:DEKNAAC105112 [Brettanomyces naardenensis]|uniref:DNA replication ATP-dependent helicase/nuclease n=1 Tax=Brettanomyces naardenensis TaxID=13370 RepID=A0A448YSW2_BRENA|nr:DEKNAAC105112 [Brettanomyces naardenensis]